MRHIDASPANGMADTLTATGTQTTHGAEHEGSAGTLNRAVRDSLARAARAHLSEYRQRA
jgi:hypothetical protein